VLNSAHLRIYILRRLCYHKKAFNFRLPGRRRFTKEELP